MDETLLSWRGAALALCGSAMVGAIVAGLALSAHDRRKARRPQIATVATPFPRS